MSMPVTDNRLTVVLIHRDELVVIAPPHHPLAKLKSAPICEVAKFPLVMPKAGHTRDALEELFHDNKLKPQYAMELDSSELLKRFVAADMGSPLQRAGRRSSQRVGRHPHGRNPNSPQLSSRLPERQGPQPRRSRVH
jgi:DNA-binding transcriptional LysR family regulator